jgi:GR25 family glycosyltransferase involved in LPS biosynthesis
MDVRMHGGVGCDRVKWAFSKFGIDVTFFEASNGQQLQLRSDKRCPRFNVPKRYQFGIHNLTMGEIGLRHSTARLFQQAKAEHIPRLVLVEDDVVLACDFLERFLRLLKDDRCGAPVHNEHGGILRLGATVHSMWKAIDSDLLNVYGNETALSVRNNIDPSGATAIMCYNTEWGSYGTFASMYHASTYSSVLNWLDEHPCEPMDWMYPLLSEQYGHLVRTAYPYPIIAEVDHISDVGARNRNQSERSVQHRW